MTIEDVSAQDQVTLVRWLRSNLKKAALCAEVLSAVHYKHKFCLSDAMDMIQNDIEIMLEDIDRIYGKE